MTRRAGGVPAALWLTLGFIGGVLFSLAGWLLYDLLRPRRPAVVAEAPVAIPSALPCVPEPTPEPTLEPEAEPEPEATPTPASARRPPRASPTPVPGPATPHPDLARHLDEGDKALAEGRAEAAQGSYERALQLDAGNARAQQGRARAVAALTALRRSFVSEVTVNDGGGVGRGLSGFEPGDVVVKKAPQVPARIEFEMHPARVKPGDAFSLTIYLVNGGKKTAKIRTLRLTQITNGTRATSEPAPLEAEVKRGQRSRLATLAGTWSASRDWSVEATVIAEHGDAYGRRLVWR